MSRKHALTTDQLDRLNERYRHERGALVVLTKARAAVEEAARRVDAASRGLEQARQQEQEAYQDVAALVGANAAAELAGGQPNGKASSHGRRPSRSRVQRAATPAATATET